MVFNENFKEALANKRFGFENLGSTCLQVKLPTNIYYCKTKKSLTKNCTNQFILNTYFFFKEENTYCFVFDKLEVKLLRKLCFLLEGFFLGDRRDTLVSSDIVVGFIEAIEQERDF